MYPGNGCSASPTSPKPFKWRVGYWLSSKKSKKFNLDELSELCKSADIQLIQLNLDMDISLQGHFDAIVHKLSDLIIQADKGEKEAQAIIDRVERYVRLHPGVIVFDPLPSVRILCDRYLQYSLISDICRNDNVYTPPFVDLTTNQTQENLAKLKSAGVTFPCICKPFVAHGSSLAHEMSIVFGEEGLKDVKPPCVAQSFVPHNGVLYKVFVIGSRHFICPRPSLKNFVAGNFPTIFFHSHSVSKDGCTSELSQADALEAPTTPPCDEKVAAVVRDIRERTGLTLFGLDIIVENGTGFHYIIDVNALPGYDGVADVHEHFLQLLTEALNDRDIELAKRQALQVSPSRTASYPVMAGSLVQSSKGLKAVTSLTEYMEQLAAYTRGQSPPDSGIGSCTESDTSDSEKKLIAALRIKQQQLLQPATVALIRPLSTAGFTPSWQRIKKFYGIPKPLTITTTGAGELAFTGAGNKGPAARQGQDSSPPHTVSCKPSLYKKPRSRTLP